MFRGNRSETLVFVILMGMDGIAYFVLTVHYLCVPSADLQPQLCHLESRAEVFEQISEWLISIHTLCF